MTAGRTALATLLLGCGLNPVCAAPQPPSADALAVAAMTSQLPPPAPLAPSTVAAAQGAKSDAPVSNLRRSDFLRAYWIDAAAPGVQSREALRKIVADCRTAGFNTICVLVRTNGTAAYQTLLTPRPTSVPAGFDPLVTLIGEARAGERPLQVLAVMNMTQVGKPAGHDPRAHIASLHPEWLSSGQKNVSEPWLDPASFGARKHLADVAADLVNRYAVDGVILEECGYAPTLDTGYNKAAVERYRNEMKAAASPAPGDAPWIQWRRTQVSETVAQIRQAVRAIRPQATVSLLARVGGVAPADRIEYVNTLPSLDRPLDVWPSAAEAGVVDAVILAAPQGTDVAAEAAALESWSRFALENRGAARVITGVQARVQDAKYTAAMMLDPILEPLASGVAVLPGLDSMERVDVGTFQQLFDPALVEAHAQRLIARNASQPGSRAGMLQLSGLNRLAVPAAPAPGGQVYLQNEPSAVAPMATPAPIGPAASSLPPLPAPPAPAADPGAAPAAPAGAPPAAPSTDLPPLPPPAAAPEPPAAPVQPSGSVPVPPPGDAAAPAIPESLPPLTMDTGAGVPSPLAVEAPAAELPPLAPVGPAPAAALPPLAPIGDPGAPAPGMVGPDLTISDNTNFSGAPIVGPTPYIPPTMTPITVIPKSHQVIGAEALPPPNRAALAAPQFAIPDFSEQDSIFVPRVAPPGIWNYAPPSVRPGDVTPLTPPAQLETIVLATGKEFTGTVLERGSVYRVQLTNGGIIALDAARVAQVRPVNTAPQAAVPLDFEPVELPPL